MHKIQEVIQIQKFRAAQDLLRAKNSTSQAGFTSERIPAKLFARRPILIDDGPEHQEHRKQLVKFFNPKTLNEKHRIFIENIAAEYVEKAYASGSAQIDQIALHFSVRVASEIVGLSTSDTPALAKRLEAFFDQPPVDHIKIDHGRTNRDWAKAALKAIVPLISFYFKDVRPAIKFHRKKQTDDIIGFLIQKGYKPREILMECLTYGTAGMVTTREFISMTMLRMLTEPELKTKFLFAEETERLAILSEIVRLEPPVAHLYRRVQNQTTDCPYRKGTLIDINVRKSNLDTEVFTTEPESVCTNRGLTASERTGLSFGDGAHRCPGSSLALIETDILVRAFLKAGAILNKHPRQTFDTLIQGYQIRDFNITFSDRADASLTFEKP